MTQPEYDEEPRYTEDGLPVVSIETVKSLLDILIRSSEQEFRREVLNLGQGFYGRLAEENPHLCVMIQKIESIGKENFGRNYSNGLAVGAFLAYEAVRMQASANQLKDNLT